jgi:hypothetical protein
MSPSASALVDKAWTALNNPSGAVNHVYHAVESGIRLRVNGQHQQPADPELVYRDWDVTVILDACRYDALNEVNPFDATCEKRVSQAPNTPRWFRRNFLETPPDLAADIVYVTANPWVGMNADDRFTHVERVYEYGWNEAAKSLYPEVVTNAALRMREQYPDARLVVHYNQPHAPFIETAHPHVADNRYESLRTGRLSRSEVRTAYIECLEYALDSVERIRRHVTGDIIVTADHGEGFGEGGVYGHPPWAHARITLEVPWIELTGDGEPIPEEILNDTPDESDSPDVDEQLEHLGYKL